MYHIRKSNINDIEVIMLIIDDARNIMRVNGNLNQWTDGYPDRQTIINDINNKNNYVVEYKNQIIGVFTFIKGPDITYKHIYEGNWHEKNKEYYVIHRAGKLSQYKGVLKEILNYCFLHADYIRIDTHSDNKIMQHLIGKYGFEYCGIIYLLNGDKRLAYDYLKSNKNSYNQ